MSISIENEEAEQLVAELGRRTGQGATDLLLDLLRREKARVGSEMEERVARGREADRKLRESWFAKPVVDPRPLNEILEWDENGLPL